MSDQTPHHTAAKSADKASATPQKSHPSAPHFSPPSSTASASTNPAPVPADEDSPKLRAVSAAKDSPRADAVLRKEHELLLEASKVAEHLHRHFVELDQRESQIARQRELLEDQRRQVQAAAMQLERELSQRTADLKEREDGFRKQMAECEELIGDLEEQQKVLGKAKAAFDEERARLQRDLQTERTNLKEDIKKELADDFRKLERANDELADERRRFAEEVEQHRKDHEESLEKNEQQLEAERAKLLEAVRAELTSERQALAKERAAWETELAKQRAELEHVQGDLADEIERHRAEVEKSKKRLEDEHAQKVAAWEKQRARQQAELEELERDLTEDIKRQQAELDSEREHDAKMHAQKVAAWKDKRDAEQKALDEARAQFEAFKKETQKQLEGERAAMEKFHAEREQKFQADLALRENRHRFQRDHLEKLRLEVETLQKEFQIDKQQSAQRHTRETELLRLRKLQLAEHRGHLGMREESLGRERDLLSKAQAAFDAESLADRIRLKEDRERFEQERRAVLSEQELQSAKLAEVAEQLVARETRLETMRQETEEINRQSLETRLAIEEAYLAYSKSAGGEAAQKGVEEAREALNKQLDKLYNQLAEKRREIEGELAEVLSKKTDFETERETLARWITDRDQTLAAWEDQLVLQSQSLDSREWHWRSLRDQWTEEKLEAEAIIRDLLNQLEDSGDAGQGPGTEEEI